MEGLSTSTTIGDLQRNSPLWYKIHVFIYDLRNFREIAAAPSRLNRIVDPSYIGMPYFSQEKAKMVKGAVTSGEKTLEAVIGETLRERLERRNNKQVESGDYRVCAAHDLAPILEKVFDIKPKELAKNQEFLTLLELSGLKLKDGDQWKVLPKRSSQKNKKKH